MFDINEEKEVKILFVPKTDRNRKMEKSLNRLTKNPRNAVWILMAAHSCLTTLKSLGGALTTVATAALKASLFTDEESEEPSDPPFLLNPFHEDTLLSPDELLHSLHFLFLPPTFSFKRKASIFS